MGLTHITAANLLLEEILNPNSARHWLGPWSTTPQQTRQLPCNIGSWDLPPTGGLLQVPSVSSPTRRPNATIWQPPTSIMVVERVLLRGHCTSCMPTFFSETVALKQYSKVRSRTGITSRDRDPLYVHLVTNRAVRILPCPFLQMLFLGHTKNPALSSPRP